MESVSRIICPNHDPQLLVGRCYWCICRCTAVYLVTDVATLICSANWVLVRPNSSESELEKLDVGAADARTRSSSWWSSCK